MIRHLSSRVFRRGGQLSSQVNKSFVSTSIVTGSSQRQEKDYSQDKNSFSSIFLGLSLAAISLTSVTTSCDSKKKDSSSKSSTDKKEQEKAKEWKVISRKEVEKHNSLDTGVWVTYGDSVYDVTSFIANHPGGKEKLLEVAGKDIAASWAIYVHHKTSLLANDLLAEMKIGVLPSKDVITPPKVTYSPKYSNSVVYDVIIVGSGLSGLQCGWSLVNEHSLSPEKILVLEAQDYVGGRVKQMKEFMKGTLIEVGAEFLHGNNTELTRFARRNNEPLREIYCWAHGDGGPEPHAADHGYGLYYIGKDANLNRRDAYRLPLGYNITDKEEVRRNSADRLLRYDDTENPDFNALNEALWELEASHEDDVREEDSLFDWLKRKRLNASMIKMGEGGFANTLCSNSDELSLKQAIRWSRMWHQAPKPGEDPDADFTFKNSFGCLVDHLKRDLQIEVNTPVHNIDYDPSLDSAGKPGEKKDNLITITTKEGTVYRARNVVLTASPYVIQNRIITFEPTPLAPEIEEAFSWVQMNPVIKVIMKFEKPAWPYHLHGMIMQDDSFLLPEVWFRTVEDEVTPDEKATAYAVGFTTGRYADRVARMSQEEVLRACVRQLDTVFSHLEPKHMSEDPADPKNAEVLKSLPRPSEVYLGGMFWDWRPEHHPYIGGGYASPLAGKPITIGEVLKKGHGGHMFFAGEATNHLPGATAHAALETGIRAAGQVASALKKKGEQK